MQKAANRIRKPVEKYGEEPGSGYILVYFMKEHKYDIILSSSTLFPHGFSFNDCRPKQTVCMKPDITARIIAKSIFEKDMEIYRTRMERKLRETENIDVSTDSLNFLNQTVKSTSEEVDEDDDTLSVHSLGDETMSMAMSSQSQSEVSHQSVSVVCPTETGTSEEATWLRKLADNQSVMIKELKKIRKSLSKNNEVVRNLQPSSIFYKGMDLVTLGRNNLEPSRYAAKLGRALFSDEELQQGMLFPKRSTGRPSLSPSRSSIFKRAFQERFPEEEEMEIGVAAVNCLGNDLKKGKRKRLDYDF